VYAGKVALVGKASMQIGTAEQRAADRGYVGRMMSAMAEGGYGPERAP
jgi:hypothetical protein